MLDDKIHRIQELNKNEKKSLLEVSLKLAEEVGELAQATLSSQNSSGAGYKNLTLQDVQEEAVDVVICSLSAFFKAGGDLDTLQRLIDKKCDKWASKQS
jgi:NTP pyrophosphatase (non-canonical NTP hydrolase)